MIILYYYRILNIEYLLSKSGIHAADAASIRWTIQYI